MVLLHIEPPALQQQLLPRSSSVKSPSLEQRNAPQNTFVTAGAVPKKGKALEDDLRSANELRELRDLMNPKKKTFDFEDKLPSHADVPPPPPKDYLVPSLATRFAVLRSRMASGVADAVSASATRELRHLTQVVDSATVVSAGGDRVLCQILSSASDDLRRANTADTAEKSMRTLQLMFAALFAVVEGHTASPPVWSTHSQILPSVLAAMDAIASEELNRFGYQRARVDAMRAGSLLYDQLCHQCKTESVDVKKVLALGFSLPLPLPPPGSRLRWVDGAGNEEHVPILIRRGVPLFPRLPPAYADQPHHTPEVTAKPGVSATSGNRRSSGGLPQRSTLPRLFQGGVLPVSLRKTLDHYHGIPPASLTPRPPAAARAPLAVRTPLSARG